MTCVLSADSEVTQRESQDASASDDDVSEPNERKCERDGRRQHNSRA